MSKNEKSSPFVTGYKSTIAAILGLVVILFLTFVIMKVLSDASALPKIPAPELSDGMRGELGIDKNVNETTIDKYLRRPDSIYRDVRLLEDPAKYENIGGDRYLSGFVDGFEVVPLPYLIKPEGLPEAVGKSYSGKTLFSRLENGKVVANYDESVKILEDLFPKDKNIFLMCGGGGYAGMTKSLLVELGWDENKIWNVGGFWYYEGDNKVNVKEGDTYAFWKVKYHMIDFDKLKEKNNA